MEYVTEDGVHTNIIEGFWGIWKADLNKCAAIQTHDCRLHLDEIVYRARYQDVL